MKAIEKAYLNLLRGAVKTARSTGLSRVPREKRYSVIAEARRGAARKVKKPWGGSDLKSVNFKFIKRWGKGHYNPHHNAVVRDKYGKHELDLPAGDSDDVYIYQSTSRNEKTYYALSLNRRMPYVGLTSYTIQPGMKSKADDSDDSEPHDIVRADNDGVFLQNDSEQEETLGKKWEDKSPMWLTKRLREYLSY
jgi:hypothetical protein